MNSTSAEVFDLRRREADLMFRRLGITFAVYGEGGDTERLIPFDIVPRVLTNPEWQRLSEGLIQRVRALNAFLFDAYHGQDFVTCSQVFPIRIGKRQKTVG